MKIPIPHFQTHPSPISRYLYIPILSDDFPRFLVKSCQISQGWTMKPNPPPAQTSAQQLSLGDNQATQEGPEAKGGHAQPQLYGLAVVLVHEFHEIPWGNFTSKLCWDHGRYMEI